MMRKHASKPDRAASNTPEKPGRAAERRATPLPGVAVDLCAVAARGRGLAIDPPGAPAEQAAERTADLAMRPGAEGVAASSRARPAVRELATPAAVSGRGVPLEPAVAAAMERRFGCDLGRVRIHTDGAAATATSALRARAYTVGHHIHFAPGMYRPGTAAGDHLLAHELTHTLQQSHAGVAAIQRDAAGAATTPRSTDQMLARFEAGQALVTASPPNYAAAAEIAREVLTWMRSLAADRNLSARLKGSPFARAAVDSVLWLPLSGVELLHRQLRGQPYPLLGRRYQIECQNARKIRDYLRLLNGEIDVAQSPVASVDRGAKTTLAVSGGLLAAPLLVGGGLAAAGAASEAGGAALMTAAPGLAAFAGTRPQLFNALAEAGGSVLLTLATASNKVAALTDPGFLLMTALSLRQSQLAGQVPSRAAVRAHQNRTAGKALLGLTSGPMVAPPTPRRDNRPAFVAPASSGRTSPPSAAPAPTPAVATPATPQPEPPGPVVPRVPDAPPALLAAARSQPSTSTPGAPTLPVTAAVRARVARAAASSEPLALEGGGRRTVARPEVGRLGRAEMLKQYEALDAGDHTTAPVTHFTPQQLELRKLTVKDGRLHRADGSLLRGSVDFVMDLRGNLYAFTPGDLAGKSGRLQHSSFLGGKPIAVGGTLFARNGRLASITNDSGHYAPGDLLLTRAVDLLNKWGAILPGTKVIGFHGQHDASATRTAAGQIEARRPPAPARTDPALARTDPAIARSAAIDGPKASGHATPSTASPSRSAASALDSDDDPTGDLHDIPLRRRSMVADTQAAPVDAAAPTVIPQRDLPPAGAAVDPLRRTAPAPREPAPIAGDPSSHDLATTVRPALQRVLHDLDVAYGSSPAERHERLRQAPATATRQLVEEWAAALDHVDALRDRGHPVTPGDPVALLRKLGIPLNIRSAILARFEQRMKTRVAALPQVQASRAEIAAERDRHHQLARSMLRRTALKEQWGEAIRHFRHWYAVETFFEARNVPVGVRAQVRGILIRMRDKPLESPGLALDAETARIRPIVDHAFAIGKSGVVPLHGNDHAVDLSQYTD